MLFCSALCFCKIVVAILAANLRSNAVRQGKDVPIVRGTRVTHVRARGTVAIRALEGAGSPRGSVWTSRGFLAAA